MSGPTTDRVTVLVHGRVQGVGFRYFVRQRARVLNLVGTATNLPDGSVEIVAEGPRPAAEQLLEALRGDDAPGFVGRVDVTWSQASGEYRTFHVW